jgi:DNA-binding NarL/FixJ family response regulator
VRESPTLIIDAHEGGFTVADKNLPVSEMLKRVEWALEGVNYTPPQMKDKSLEVKPEWLEVLDLAFREELQDKEIAKRMGVVEKTVRNYWSKIQNALGVYPDPSKNLRIQTEVRARERGLID